MTKEKEELMKVLKGVDLLINNYLKIYTVEPCNSREFEGMILNYKNPDGSYDDYDIKWGDIHILRNMFNVWKKHRKELKDND